MSVENDNRIKPFTASLGTTIDRFIAEREHEYPEASGELSQLLRDIVLASKVISREINRAGLSGIEGILDEENVQGEKQRMLDVIADVRFTRSLIRGGQVCAILSEEREGIIDTQKPFARYVVAIDPLDGSSNIDVNVSVGSIFSIYKRVSPIGGAITQEDFLQKGKEQIAAGYILYGSSTMLVYTTGNGVNGFTYEPSLGEYFLSYPNIAMPKVGSYYSVNESDADAFPEEAKSYLSQCKQKRLDTRYVGSLVGDFHRNLLKGGIYFYPQTKKYPNGKLRLLYECNALAFVAEQAGGLAVNGRIRILDVMPEAYHERVAFITGSKEMVNDYLNPPKQSFP